MRAIFGFKCMVCVTAAGSKHHTRLLRFASTMVTSTMRNSARNKLVRVRFAPSPTGFLHLGGLRTALYNFLFAKSQGGQFVLRIEDTDQSRLVAGAADQIEQDLMWAGIAPDESPSLGGSYGPYVQSERLALYQNQAQVLLNSGAAYRCFCTDRRLEMIRKDALRQRQVPGYDNRCRHLTKEEVKEKMKSDAPHCIRFKLASTSEAIPDLVYGNIVHELTEGDPVILKKDGFPTYHLANVVDDHMMVITHVLRGVEWQISTPKHILLYRAFGWEPPQYAHLPLIMNPDGTKLSKRQGDIQVQSYKSQGIFPLALLNYITKAGGGFRNTTLDDVLDMDALVHNFDLERLNPHSCRLSSRLLEYNQKELQKKLSNTDTIDQCVQDVIDLVKSRFPTEVNNGSVQLHPEHVNKILHWSQNRVHKMSELVEPNLAFLWLLPSQTTLHDLHLKQELFQKILISLSAVKQFNSENLKPELRKLAPELGIPFNKLMKILRSAISGLKEGPGVAEMMEILGPDATLARIRTAMTVVNDAS